MTGVMNFFCSYSGLLSNWDGLVPSVSKLSEYGHHSNIAGRNLSALY